MPAKEESEGESDGYASSFNYSPEIQSFAIGDGRIGLHVSSYEEDDEGSALDARGRDVFLIFNPKMLELREDKDLALLQSQIHAQMRGAFVTAIERGQERGELSRSQDPRE